MDTIIFSMVVLHTAFGGAGAQYTPGKCPTHSPLTIPGAERTKVYAVVALNACAPLRVARAHV